LATVSQVVHSKRATRKNRLRPRKGQPGHPHVKYARSDVAAVAEGYQKINNLTNPPRMDLVYRLPMLDRSNYKEGFEGKVLAAPDLAKAISPPVGDVVYHDSLLRASVRKAVEEQLKIEQPKLEGKLQMLAAEAARGTKGRTQTIAKRVATRAFLAARGLLVKKAQATCARVSKVKQLPKICAQEATRFFNPVLKPSTSTWATAAADAVQVHVDRVSTAAAISAVADVSTAVAPPVAYQRARKVYARVWPKMKSAYASLAAKSSGDLAAEKAAFWANAEKDIVAKVRAAVTKAVWRAPMSHANRVIVRVAKQTADKTSRKAVAKHLAPFFQRAAKIAVDKAVKSANQKVMAGWKADWDGLP